MLFIFRFFLLYRPLTHLEIIEQRKALTMSTAPHWKAFYEDEGNNYDDNATKARIPEKKERKGSSVARILRDGLVGAGAEFEGPFGRRPLTYCDYIASGRAVQSIELFIQNEVN